MLGKTAGGLFWMFRFLERSENTARLLDAGFRIGRPSSRRPVLPMNTRANMINISPAMS